MEKAVLVGLIQNKTDEVRHVEYLEELAFLVDTAGGQVLKKFVQRVPHPHPATFVGAGKLEEIKSYVARHAVDMVVFDDELSPAQIKNLELAFNPDRNSTSVKILDRTTLILDIFASRARTAHAKLQVELAQLQYLLPRLTRMWTHLERQKGGIGMRGPGETQIESDRRAIQNRIALLREKLKSVDRVMATQRQSRRGLPRVALVGYTNVGKSTLMNQLAKAQVFAENKLFATLDTTVRKLVWEGVPILLSDTVGFIRKLPTPLVESFKSTLDEVREADLLLHVVDISHPSFQEQIQTVKKTLEEIGAGEKPVIMVFNKCDLYVNEDREPWELEGEFEKPSLQEFQRTFMARENSPAVFISALNRDNLDVLRKQIVREIKKAFPKGISFAR
ncbi:MAG: GTPase HflX [Flavobacteriales bacterium]|nr:GTPase HflX [Flavobacteriales bacterium]MDW8432117.1 GTPase HflX [Flavobacteriales bacterium]